MSNHTNQPDALHAPEMCLLLRAHCEQHWLESELLPVLEQLERPDSLPEEQRGAALAYLEVLSLDAHMRATDTDDAAARLEHAAPDSDHLLAEEARRYHAAVRRRRSTISVRVAQLTPPLPCDEVLCDSASAHQHASF
jgi:hypothetical protein